MILKLVTLTVGKFEIAIVLEVLVNSMRGPRGIVAVIATLILATHPFVVHCKSLVPAKVTVLEFPSQTSIGSLYRVDEKGALKFFGLARGKVSLPPNFKLALSANYKLLNSKQSLALIPPNSLYSLTMKSIESENGQVFDISTIKSQRLLRVLDNAETDISDESLAGLRDLHQLTDVTLWYCGISGARLDSLKGHRSLVRLNLAFNRLCPAAWSALGTMTQLKRLVLTSTSADDTALAEIGKLTNLKTLKINGNAAITGKGLLHLKACKYLEILDVTGCDVTLRDFETIRMLPIKTLFVSGDCLSDLEKRKLKTIFPTTQIVDGSKVDGETKFLFSPLH